ncbi:phage GP46 family protein [Pandoraea anapnoica]|uniref:Phage GP46 family protein n=1 Tax=Pandoraea anapnoica TaxID=2508301 RepID=A0A5E5AW09_9BURK|nr:phage GP46 family protein [Pandoraea anapnoica]VVE76350.1 phage GP46 family protein [Pandoraea anapnoica]
MDALIDPHTGGYTGEQTNTLQNAVYLRLSVPLGTWWADRKVGSLLYTLARSKDLPRTRNLAVQYAEQALAPLMDDGRASKVAVEPKTGKTGVIVLVISVYQSNGQVDHFEHPVRVS